MNADDQPMVMISLVVLQYQARCIFNARKNNVSARAEELRAGKEVVLASVARSGYEFEFEAEALRADAYVAAWAARVCVCAPCLAAQ